MRPYLWLPPNEEGREVVGGKRGAADAEREYGYGSSDQCIKDILSSIGRPDMWALFGYPCERHIMR